MRIYNEIYCLFAVSVRRAHVSLPNTYVDSFALSTMEQPADTPDGLLSRVLVPVATEQDARNTAEQLAAYSPETVIALYVVEKGGGAPDKTSVEYSETVAQESFDAIREQFPDVETATVYDTSILNGIFETAKEVDATAIVYRSRGGNRLAHFLSGDLSLKLVTKADRPVIALPQIE